MKSKTNKSPYVFLTKSEAIAKDVLGLTFETYSYEFLSYQLHLWLQEITRGEDAEVLFERLDEILENYSTRELMDPYFNIKGIGINPYLRFVGLFIFLLVLVKSSWMVYGEAIQQKKENAWNMGTSSEAYRELTQMIQCGDVQVVQQTLAEVLIRTTGKGYYQYFLNILKQNKPGIEETLLEMENDPDLRIHKNEMVLFVSIRCFIDSSFFLFGENGDKE